MCFEVLAALKFTNGENSSFFVAISQSEKFSDILRVPDTQHNLT
jgi:hypothetical protein